MSDDNRLSVLIKAFIGDDKPSVEDELLKELAKEPLLSAITSGAAVFMQKVVFAVARKDMQQALDEVFNLADEDIPDEHAESYLLLAQKLSAICEYPDGWILFSKEYIRFLLDADRIDDALVVINDLETFLPNDTDLRDFRTQTGVEKIANIVVTGVNKLWEAVERRVSVAPDKLRYKLAYYCDLTGQCESDELNGIRIIDLNKLAQLYQRGDIDKIVITYASLFSPSLGDICDALRDVGINEDVFIVPSWFYDGTYDFVHYSLQSRANTALQPLYSSLYPADMSKEVLRFVIALSNLYCNNNCKSCLSAAPLVDPDFIPLESILSDIKKMREIYWHITTLRLSGGEPLLHPDIIEIVKAMREAFPAAGLAVQSNGNLLLKDDGRFNDLFKVMHDNNIGFQISTYKPVHDRRDKLDEVLKAHGVQWHWGQISGEIIEEFWLFRTLKPDNDMVAQHNACFSTKTCHTLYDGHLYPCFIPMSSKILENHFGVEFEGLAENFEEMRINLHDTEMTGREINNFLTTPSPMCKYCNFEKLRKTKWGQCPPDKAKLEDFVVF